MIILLKLTSNQKLLGAMCKNAPFTHAQSIFYFRDVNRYKVTLFDQNKNIIINILIIDYLKYKLKF